MQNLFFILYLPLTMLFATVIGRSIEEEQAVILEENYFCYIQCNIADICNCENIIAYTIYDDNMLFGIWKSAYYFL